MSDNTMTAAENAVYSASAKILNASASAQGGPALSNVDRSAVAYLAIWQGFVDGHAQGTFTDAEVAHQQALLAKHPAASIAVAANVVWAHSPALKQEFPSAEIYAGFVASEMAGGGARRPLRVVDAFAGLSDPAATEQQWRADWANSSQIQREFRSVDGYVAYMRNEISQKRRGRFSAQYK